jgi:hypothetical protein
MVRPEPGERSGGSSYRKYESEEDLREPPSPNRSFHAWSSCMPAVSRDVDAVICPLAARKSSSRMGRSSTYRAREETRRENERAGLRATPPLLYQPPV